MLPIEQRRTLTPEELAWMELRNEPIVLTASGQVLPPSTPPPPQLGEEVEQTPMQPEPLNLPPFAPMSEVERDLYLPLFALSKGIRLPEDDDFMANLYRSYIADEFERETRLQAFDAYRRTLEMRAEHDQRIRQLFAPIASDFNAVFSSEALNTALLEVIAAYKATNPKISWNRLSPQSRMMFIRDLKRQGKLPPTLQNLLQHWERLRTAFFNYRRLLHPQDAQVVAELERILGNSPDEFLMPFLTRNDPQEEAEEQLKKQLQLYEQLQQRYAFVPQTGGEGQLPRGRSNLSFGRGAPIGGVLRGGVFTSGTPTSQPPVLDPQQFRAALDANRRNFRQGISQTRGGQYQVPDISNYGGTTTLDNIFGANAQQTIRNLLPGKLGLLASLHFRDSTSVADLKVAANTLLNEIRRLQQTGFQNLTPQDEQMLAKGLAALFLLQYANFVGSYPHIMSGIAQSREAQITLVSRLLDDTITLATSPLGDKAPQAISRIKGLFNLNPQLSISDNYRLMAETGQQPGSRVKALSAQISRWGNYFASYANRMGQVVLHRGLEEGINQIAKPYILKPDGTLKDVDTEVVSVRLGTVKTYADIVGVFNALENEEIKGEIIREAERKIKMSNFAGRKISSPDETEIVALPYLKRLPNGRNTFDLYLIFVPVPKGREQAIRQNAQRRGVLASPQRPQSAQSRTNNSSLTNTRNRGR